MTLLNNKATHQKCLAVKNAQTLLDRPFDELTSNEWECLKQQSLGEIVVEDILKDLEIDGSPDSVFGTIYRIWSATKLLGSFYQEPDGLWVAQPSEGEFHGRLSTPDKSAVVDSGLRANQHSIVKPSLKLIRTQFLSL